ncbi:GAF domain-containing sensor histidine kinase [Jiella pacifica]|uniref:histidine kinase n=1 Tax=Jiella pacifica TaxID=2696469 RepID=A0A6N9T6F1_9HYPH|nr:GAF domain-containing sensor histidine kinase [Jiella pacifica]NDW06142.1 GAF domain-containing protein [Jiella pacifica]
MASAPTILDVICRSTGMGFAAIARVTADRWITCKVLDTIGFGLKPGDELDVETTLCHEVRGSREAVVINKVSESDLYCNHPTPRMYAFESYISMPIIRRDGSFFGTLCAIDPRPARVESPEIVGMFKLFADLIAHQLDADEKLRSAETDLSNERRVAELREQFIAVLGHDLRNPVASVESGMKMLLTRPLDERSQMIVRLVQGSVLRMRGLIDNVLDFARGRLGDGIELDRNPDEAIEPILQHVVAELQAAHPDRSIETDFQIGRPVDCDRSRIAQLLSNLLANALTHGAPEQPVRVVASTSSRRFTLSVANGGSPIPEETLAHLFKPFFRGKALASQQGLGLGLFISSEIARAHGGTLRAVSDEGETQMTFEMPLSA